MTQRFQIARSSVPGQRPAALSRPTGELYVNFPDRQIGIVLPDGSAQDLVGIPFYNSGAAYAADDMVRHQGRILRALTAIAAGTPFDPAQWVDIEGLIPVSATAPASPGVNDLWIDTSGVNPEFRYFHATFGWQPVNSGYLSTLGGVLGGPISLPMDGGTMVDPALTDPALAFGDEGTSGLAWVQDRGLQLVIDNVTVARTWHDPLDPTATPTTDGDDVLPTRRQGDARWLRLTGGAMQGALTLQADPAAPLGAATKQYVDAKAGGATVSADPPATAGGAFWFETDTGILWCFDGTNWVGVGGDAKVSIGGGTMTGHLRVPAGATGDQVPRASDVLLKTGGTATGRVIFDRAQGIEIPQRTAGTAQIIGDGAPVDGLRIRFGGTGGAGGALSLTSGEGAWIALAPSAQSLETSTRLLQIVGGLKTSEEISLHSELTFTRSGPSYITWNSAQDLTFRRGGSTVAVLTAGGTTAPAATTLMTREKGDARYLQLSGSTGLAGDMDANGYGILHAGRVTFSPAEEANPNHITWLAGTGLRGFEAGTLAFELGPLAAKLPGVYSDTDSSAANVFVTSAGNLRRSTSSVATKASIQPLAAYDARGIVETLNPVAFASRLHPAEYGGRRFMGFIAEEIAAALPQAAQDGGLNYDVRAIVAVLTQAMKQVFDRLDRLEYGDAK